MADAPAGLPVTLGESPATLEERFVELGEPCGYGFAGPTRLGVLKLVLSH